MNQAQDAGAARQEGRSGEGRRVLLGEICDIQSGMPALKPGQYVAEGLPVVHPVDLVGHRLTDSPSRHVPVEDAERLGRYAVADGDLLMTRSGTVGRVARATSDEQGWLNGPSLIRLRVREREYVDPDYLLACLASSAGQEWIRRAAAGSTIQHLSMRLLADLPVHLPGAPEQRRVGRTLKVLEEKIRAHEDVVRATRALRDALTDEMTSGGAHGVGAVDR
ncbi:MULTISPECIES: restriction endonuclease subunit S [Streptomyces]|uniref:N-6 DNA methylase n=1 Tax=Streptomyces venezuelae TaxID=54571 RepID=A0A5P2ARL8_STRVZ|nr:restriction endonuclease subunit S [Streptomyces venezuelae]QES20823.1 N-6 DNA methylase [Streptomyces venezuelae]